MSLEKEIVIKELDYNLFRNINRGFLMTSSRLVILLLSIPRIHGTFIPHSLYLTVHCPFLLASLLL